MAYTDPTANDLQAAFPRFAAVADPTVEFWLVRARRSVDQSWFEDDYQMGQMLLACHLMTLQGLGTGAESEAASQGASGYKTIRSGAITLERFDNGSGGAADGFAATSYGQQFALLLRQNRGGARVAPTGTIPFDPWRYPQGEE
jgi:hypothetical protein